MGSDWSPKQALPLTGENMAYCMNNVTYKIAYDSAKPITFKEGDVILEAACGHGVCAQSIIEQHEKKDITIYASDLSQSMIDYTAAMAKRLGWEDRVHTSIERMEAMSYADNMFTHSFNYFIVFAVRDPDKVVQEMVRTLKPGGMGVIATWQDDGNDWGIIDAHKATRPEGEMHFKLNPRRLAHKDEASLVDLMKRNGFTNITSTTYAVENVIPDMTRYSKTLWSLCGAGTHGWNNPGDEEQFDKAVSILEASLRASSTFTSDGGAGGTIKLLGNVATGYKPE